MAELSVPNGGSFKGGVPAAPPGAVPMGDFAGGQPGAGGWQDTIRAFTQQPAFKRAVPGLIGLGVVAAAAAVYLAISTPPQRILYSSLTDAERASVVQTLEAGGIDYNIDTSSGILTVSEADIYRARMLVASDAGLAAPQGASEMLDSIPLGSSRTLEGERLRLARERELMLTIREIDGIEAVRVHLATPERSVFVRENNPPSASVMLRLANGRSLSQPQVEAIVNLVSGSVPGMTPDNVRVVDQNGRLLSAPREDQLDGLLLQREFEAKLQEQVASLLTPILGEGNFSSQVQAELVREEVTSARETYDQEGAVRSESERNSSRVARAGPGGVPGAAANVPPPDPELEDVPPDPEAQAAEAELARDTESAVQRNYELGREVAVTSSRPGGLVKLSVAIAVSEAALEAAAPMTAEQLQTLVSAAVGADEARGDQVEIAVGAFDDSEVEPMAFYEQGWFAQILRIVAALLAVLMVLLLAVRPLIKAVKGPEDEDKKKDKKGKKGKKDDEDDDKENADQDKLEDQSEDDEAGDNDKSEGDDGEGADGEGEASADNSGESADTGVPLTPQQLFEEKIGRARELAVTQPEKAVEVLQRMIDEPEELAEEAQEEEV
ncbi:flagellar M-ring protein FliF [Erythrobacter sp. SCSIO 43205]|uniref:flagellar basal-body MS-ring/collar protein FliF n=1 Tax=Erythrobacter sp. SCSIO 43205 TaxID=2779361 RepID=UPI001CA8A96A|nr:flagellar basal-body MS-ring/collar protein FliF [Erythrobacter sp. SCSIO 43205]UAB78739.1 flagellar M-ring protein FliF [Erythrobacter sp. SCSIO 43205]